MKKFGRELDSKKHWDGRAADYLESLETDYHRDRLATIRELIPETLLAPNRRVFEFGCGDAVIFPLFLQAGAQIEGMDASNEMVMRARQRLKGQGYDEALVNVGDVRSLSSIESDSLDALMSFNVLAYLTGDEEALFYQQASRIIKRGGVPDCDTFQ